MQNNANVTNKDNAKQWQLVQWRECYRVVKNLRRRIFKATRKGRWKTVRNLQRLLLKSFSNILVAVRQVTQLNVGKRSAGIDKKVALTPQERWELVNDLKQVKDWLPRPTRRVYVPKPNGKKRPLGIPTIKDRALQAIVREALEPCWEAQFEPYSYGFRPGRSCHDAIERIHTNLKQSPTGQPPKKQWILDADIKGCFDNIDHEKLLKTIGNFPARRMIWRWLKAGYMEDGKAFTTKSGTPQGGVISPLLANIALHGMESAIGVSYKKHKSKKCQAGYYWQVTSSRVIIRYADDFVVLCETEEDAIQTKERINQWLNIRGLSFSEDKPRIFSHISEGFNFLGFNIRIQKDTNRKSGNILLIKPSNESIKKIRMKIKQIWFEAKGKELGWVLKRLTPVIRGWSNYFSIAVSKDVFSSLDHWMYQRQVRYVKHKHPNKPEKWKNRYWGNFLSGSKDKWIFGDKTTGAHIPKFSWTKIRRHRVIAYDLSPDNPEHTEQLICKEREKKKSKELIRSHQKIASNQNHICPQCGQSLYNGEEYQVHHIIPRSQGGKDTYKNLIILHEECHKTVHHGKH